MATLQQVLENIKNTSLMNPVNSLLDAKEADRKREAQALEQEALRQRVADNRSALGNELGRNLDIRNPQDAEYIRNVMRVRGVKEPVQYTMPTAEKPTADARTDEFDFVPATEGETRTVDAHGIDKMKQEAGSWFAPEEKKAEYAIAQNAFRNKANEVNTDIIDNILAGKTIDWTELAKARAYLTDDQAKEAMQPWEEKVRQSNALGRSWTSAQNKDEQREKDVQKSFEDAIRIAQSINPTIPVNIEKKREDFRQSIRVPSIAYMTDPAKREAWKQKLKADVLRVSQYMGRGNSPKTELARENEKNILLDIIDQEFK